MDVVEKKKGWCVPHRVVVVSSSTKLNFPGDAGGGWKQMKQRFGEAGEGRRAGGGGTVDIDDLCFFG